MVPEIGIFALIMALCMALVQAFFPLLGAARGVPNWMAVARPAAMAQLAFVATAFMALAYSFIADDFSVAFVANHSNSALPFYYKLTAIWGGHEGSILLWTLVLALWTTAVALFSRSLPTEFAVRVLGVMGLVSVGFLLFMLLTSNPFARLAPAPAEGADLNPVLQDPGMIVHPPILYMGYVGFSVAFGFAIAALLGGQLDTAWARWTRPWTGVAWIFLTLGVTLGSWWSYYELGWGGWWFWDPVENASFMPWLVGTALIHSLAVTEKRGMFKSWTVLLAITAFSLSLLGTFLVRSGVLTSVHAFAQDPTRGIYILTFLGLVIGGSLALYAWRGPKSLGGGRFQRLSRESFLLVNNVLMVVAMLTVLLGTLYPLAIDALGLGKLSVGPPYFNAVFVPLALIGLALMGIAGIVRWRQDQAARLWYHLRYAALAGLVVGLGVAAMFGEGEWHLTVILGIGFAVWVVLSSLQAVRLHLSSKRSLWGGLRNLPGGFYGMVLAHIGVAISVIGVTLTSAYNTEVRTRMAPGDAAQVAAYTFRFKEVREFQGPNYQATEGVIEVTHDSEPVTVLRPQKRFYQSQEQPMTEAGIDAGLTRDLYASLGDPLDGENEWSVRLYHKPFVRWIWFGALFVALGGGVALSDQRYRRALYRRSFEVAGRSPVGLAEQR